jgi:hypothetical protein
MVVWCTILGSSSGESDGEDDNLEREEDENLKRALSVQKRRELEIQRGRADGSLAKAEALHIDDMSDDDDETPRNTIGNVPLKWYPLNLSPQFLQPFPFILPLRSISKALTVIPSM